MAYQNKSRRNYRHGRWHLQRPGGVLEVTERWIWERLVKDPSLLKLEGASTNHRSNRRIPNPCPVTRRSYFRWVPGEVINCTVFEGGRTPSRSSSAFIIADRQWPRRNSRESRPCSRPSSGRKAGQARLLNRLVFPSRFGPSLRPPRCPRRTPRQGRLPWLVRRPCEQTGRRRVRSAHRRNRTPRAQ